MPNAAILVDFGSTYTKVVAVDLDRAEILATAQHPSTADSDVTIGLERALAGLRGVSTADVRLRLASSSARGGLRLVAIGLVPELTAEAARLAALGAGAKVVRVYSHQLTPADIDEIDALQPDLVLLAGGTDGGNREVITLNAAMLARSNLAAPVIMAGNRVARDAVEQLLRGAGKRCYVTTNVLPELDQLNVEPVRAVIRETFIRHIVEAKGLDRAKGMIDGIIMPTPAAVLEAAQLLAQGTADEPGLGDLMVVDVGGATTDVHSISSAPPGRGLVPRGLPEPLAKRTVEGDLGVRVNAQSVVELGHTHELRTDLAAELRAPQAKVRSAYLAANTGALALTADELRMDVTMASACVDIAMERHVGHVKDTYGIHGPVQLLYGKDLRDVKALIGVGGVFAFGTEPRAVLRAGLGRSDLPHSLRPQTPALYHDAQYVFYAMGLLASREPAAALRLLKKSLVNHG